jgi:phosphodiesterase/alkaline phosphatase D-like protein
MASELVLGPLLRHVDPTSAAVWVQTGGTAMVSVRLDGDGRVWTAPTFAVHGCHYALVEVTGLTPGLETTYRVEVDGSPVWPLPDDERPPSRLRTPPQDRVPRLAFGSCRTSVPHDAKGHLTHGVDALRSYGIAQARGDDGVPAWPDAMLLLGDQVYADDLSPEMKEFISSRRSLSEPPGAELKDYDEYAHLYTVAWGEPWVRWVLSCLPTMMIFDDHDVRDDWNTSWQWRRQMEATSWWHGRIVAALASYWVYQHLGNLSVQERAQDEIWLEVVRRWEEGEVEPDLTDVLDAFAERVDQQPRTYRWSYARDFGDARLVVADSRAGRVLEEGSRSMLDPDEMEWLDGQLRGGCSHLLIGTSLPFLLPTGLHHLESWNEAVVDGVWGRRASQVAERIRQVIDLEHWAAFQDGFREVCRMVDEVAQGRRGAAPSSVTFLSGDVHHSYISEVRRAGGTRILQFVCSPIRNPLPRPLRAANVVASHRVAEVVGGPMAGRAKVPPRPMKWDTLAGPWYDNNIAVLELHEEQMQVSWWTGEVEGGDHEHPRLARVARVDLDVPPPDQPHHPARAEVRATSRRRLPRGLPARRSQERARLGGLRRRMGA